MKRLVVLIFTSLLVALSAGQVLRLPSSYENGVKWTFDVNVPSDILVRSHHVGHVPVQPVVYQKEPLVSTVYRKESARSDVYNKRPVLPVVRAHEKSIIHNGRTSVYKKDSAVVNASKPQTVLPTVYKAQPVSSSVYKQQSAVPVAHKTRPVASAVYRSQPIKPTVYHQDQRLHYVVPAGPQVDSW